jgi:ribosome-binding factor A
MSIRTEKVASVIKRILASAIQDLMSFSAKGMVTVTAVRITNDLSIAKVYVSIYGKDLTPGDVIKNLEDNKGSLRHTVGTQIKLRHTPDLRFYIDDTINQMEHIQELLNLAKVKSDPE